MNYNNYFKTIKEPLFNKGQFTFLHIIRYIKLEFEILKQDKYMTNLVIKAEKVVEDHKLGFIELYIIRKEDSLLDIGNFFIKLTTYKLSINRTN